MIKLEVIGFPQLSWEMINKLISYFQTLNKQKMKRNQSAVPQYVLYVVTQGRIVC